MHSRLAAFDMDGTLLNGRIVFALAGSFGLEGKVVSIQQSQIAGFEKTENIAALFSGLTLKDLESAVESLPLTANCEHTVSALKERDFAVGIISDSYTAAANIVADRLQMDFVAANNLEFKNGVITGKVDMPLGWENIGCPCRLSVCKRFHLEKYARMFGVAVENTVAVGDTRSDLCMVERAGTGIAFMPKDDMISGATSNVVHVPDFLEILKIAT